VTSRESTNHQNGWQQIKSGKAKRLLNHGMRPLVQQNRAIDDMYHPNIG
jgi:hypothetical protein